MNNNGKSNKSTLLNNIDFDLGLNNNCSRSMNDQKNQSSTFVSTQSRHNTMSSAKPSWQANKPSWSYQPAANQSGIPASMSGPTSMVGDIFGKSWNSSYTTNSASNVGITSKNPNLFGDLLSSALEQSKDGSGATGNVPLKNASISKKGAYSMGGMSDSLPKEGNAVKMGANMGSSWSSRGYNSAYNSSSKVNASNSNNKGPTLEGQPTRNFGSSGSVSGGGVSSNKDPFGSLVDFSSKPAGGMNSSRKGTKTTNSDGNDFGDFQDAPKPTSSFQYNASSTSNKNSNGTNMDSYSKVDDFGFFSNQSQPPVQSSGVDSFDSLFSSSSSNVGTNTKRPEESSAVQFSGADDWGFDSEFSGGHDAGGTTELEGLPPPPAGVTASAAKNKGMDNQKQGQYADAIKWLSWAVVLFEKSGDDAVSAEVLSCRASCYKEVGEYKKAVADCTKVLEQDDKNISVLVQRALLYESMEKYKLGAEDLRTVLKLDPVNRVAKSTIHRLTKMAG